MAKRDRPIEISDDDEQPASIRSSPELDDSAMARRLYLFNKRFETATRTNDEVLLMQLKLWTARCYDHFDMPPSIFVTKKGTVQYKYQCKEHRSARPVMRKREDVSTANLLRHVKRCTHEEDEQTDMLRSFANGSTYTKSRLRFLLVLWVIRHHRPFAIIQDAELVSMFRMFCARVEVPSPTTLSRDVQEIFQMAKINIIAKLKEYPGKFHIGIDGWTSPNTISFLGVVVHFVDNKKISSFILDFVKLTRAHTGSYLAEELVKCLKEYGISKKILGVVCDNASNNDTLVSKLELVLNGQNGTHTRIRCFAHVINLVVKATLSLFTYEHKPVKRVSASGAEDVTEPEGEDDDMDSADEDDDEEMDNDYDGDHKETDLTVDFAREASDDRFLEELQKEIGKRERLRPDQLRLGRGAITKLKRLAKRTCHSPNLIGDLQMCCEATETVPAKKMVRAVPTRWNSVTEAIGRALYLRSALDKLVDLKHHNGPQSSHLKRYKFNSDEWELLAELYIILQPFLRATERISKSATPLLHEVIPLIDALSSKLDTAILNKTHHPLIRAAASRGREVLNKYYAKSDESIMYRMAMMLHPRYKTAYFENQKWPAEWISAAKDVLSEQWDENYKPTVIGEDEPTADDDTINEPDFLSDIDNWGKNGESQTKLNDYLHSPIVPSCKDPIAYWVPIANAGDAFALMALDFLSAPATSVDVERSFSRGTLTVSKYRHALSDESTRAQVVLGSWSRIPGAVVEDDIVEAFDKKAKRIKSKKKDADKDVEAEI